MAKKIGIAWMVASLILIDITSITFFTDLLTKANDVAVALGVINIGVLLTCNLLIIKSINKILKKTKV